MERSYNQNQKQEVNKGNNWLVPQRLAAREVTLFNHLVCYSETSSCNDLDEICMGQKNFKEVRGGLFPKVLLIGKKTKKKICVQFYQYCLLIAQVQQFKSFIKNKKILKEHLYLLPHRYIQLHNILSQMNKLIYIEDATRPI